MKKVIVITLRKPYKQKYSMRKASKTNNIAHRILQNKINNQHQNKKKIKKKKKKIAGQLYLSN